MSAVANPNDELDYFFIDAIARGWGVRINCRECAEYRAWSDRELADRFILQLDHKMTMLRGRLKCPKCGDKENLTIHPYQAGAMDWRPFRFAISDTVAAIEDHKAELRERAAAQAAPDVPSSYAGAKMRD